MKKIKWSVNGNYAGKPEGMWLTAHDWVNVETSVEDFFELVAVDGRSFCCQLKDGYRTDDNFICMGVAAVDIDTGMTIDQLLEHEFYKAFGGGFYITPSHRWNQHRFRILFFLENEIDDPDRMRYLYKALIKEFHGDDACNNPSRLFFGTPNCDGAELHPDVVLPDLIVDALIEEAKEAETAYVQPFKGQLNFGAKAEDDFDVEKIKPIASGNRDNKLRDIANVMYHKNVPFSDALQNIRYVAQTRCNPPFNVREAEMKVKRRYRQ